MLPQHGMNTPENEAPAEERRDKDLQAEQVLKPLFEPLDPIVPGG